MSSKKEGKMGRDSDKQRNSWLLRPKPRTLGDAMQRGSREGPDAGAPPASAAGQDARQADWQQLPDLPKWPPLPEEDPFAANRPTGLTEETAAVTDGAALYDQQTAPPWDPAASDGYALPGRPQRTVWQRFRTMPRRARIGVIVAAVSVIVLVCTLASVAALGNAFLNQATGAAHNTPGGQTNGQAGAPTTGNTTPTAATSPTATSAPTTPTPSSFAITFTCASGSIGGTGQVCVHTLPNASVSISVRYCDGNDATGKGLRGSAHTNGSGDYTWQWKVTTHCAGAATATVTAKSGGQTVTDRTTFTITR